MSRLRPRETYSTADNTDSACTAWKACEAGTYATGGTSSADRSCVACAEGKFSTAPNVASCTAFQTCPTGQYGSGGSSTADHTCTALTVCANTEYESSAPTHTADRVCTGISCSVLGYKGEAGACLCDEGYSGSVSYSQGAPTGCEEVSSTSGSEAAKKAGGAGTEIISNP